MDLLTYSQNLETKSSKMHPRGEGGYRNFTDITNSRTLELVLSGLSSADITEQTTCGYLEITHSAHHGSSYFQSINDLTTYVQRISQNQKVDFVDPFI